MVSSFEQALDRCLDRVSAGENVETILGDFPGYASRLRPLLLTAVNASEAYSFAPSDETKKASRERFMATMAESRESRRVRQPWFNRVIGRPLTWAAIAGVIAVLVVAYVGLRTVVSPGSTGVLPITPIPSANGNFVFQVSDEVNAIADFQSVTVIISKIGLQEASDGKWIEFEPEVTQVDLTKVPNGITQKMWQGDLPAGSYSQVFVYIDDVSGILKTTGETTEIKLPSNKLHISKPFTVADNTTTRFTYDMTVFATGNGHNTKYILKPQVDQSGATQEPSQPQPPNKSNGDNGNSQIGRPTSLPPSANTPPKKRK